MLQTYVTAATDWIVNSDLWKVGKLKWDKLGWEKQKVALSVGACGLCATLLYMKQKYDFDRKLANLKQQGYYPTDVITSIYGEAARCTVSKNNQEILNSMTVNGIFVYNNALSFTYSQCIEYWANVAMEYIPFRSVLHYKLNTYFWIECGNNNNVYKRQNTSNAINIKNEINEDNVNIGKNMNRLQFYQQYGFDIGSMVKYVEIDMNINDFNSFSNSNNNNNNNVNSGIIYTIDDALMDYVLEIMQKENNEYDIRYEEKWYEYYTKRNKPCWNVIYFNFINLNKCLVLVQWDHSMCDGILFSRITETMHKKMFDKHDKNNFVIQSLSHKTKKTENELARKNSKNVKSTSFGNRIFNKLYWYSTIPTSIYNLIINPILGKNDPKYPTFSEKISRKKVTLFGPTISLDVFKKTAKSQNVCNIVSFFAIFDVLSLDKTYKIQNVK